MQEGDIDEQCVERLARIYIFNYARQLVMQLLSPLPIYGFSSFGNDAGLVGLRLEKPVVCPSADAGLVGAWSPGIPWGLPNGQSGHIFITVNQERHVMSYQSSRLGRGTGRPNEQFGEVWGRNILQT